MSIKRIIMATYKSEKVGIAYPAETVYTKLSNLEGLSSMLKDIPEDKVPADKLAMLEQVKVTPDTISFPGGPVGDVTLKVVEKKESVLIRLEGVGTPVPMGLSLNVLPLTPDTCEAYVEIDVQIPAMLKPMVNGPLQQMADQFGTMLRQIPFA